MRLLLFLIIFFLIFRFVAYYLTQRRTTPMGSSSSQNPNKKTDRFNNAEDADFEIIEDDENKNSKVNN